MKQPMTRAQIRSINNTTLSVSYCGMQHLLINHQPFAYNGGVYGWNWDAYNVYGITILHRLPQYDRAHAGLLHGS